MLAAIGMLAYNFTVTLPLFVTDALHSTGSVFTILYSIFSVRGGRQRPGRRAPASRADACTSSSAPAALGCDDAAAGRRCPAVGLAVPAVFLVGMASILYLTATTAIVQVEARPEMHGRVLALQTVLVGGATVIGGPVLGWLADPVGGRAPIALGGVVCLIAAAFGYLATRRYVHRETTSR